MLILRIRSSSYEVSGFRRPAMETLPPDATARRDWPSCSPTQGDLGGDYDSTIQLGRHRRSSGPQPVDVDAVLLDLRTCLCNPYRSPGLAPKAITPVRPGGCGPGTPPWCWSRGTPRRGPEPPAGRTAAPS